MSEGRVKSPLTYGGHVAALFAAYFLTARMGLQLDAVSGFATLVWPPTGIALASLLLFGLRLWPGVALGAFLANLAGGAPIISACGIAVGNTLEAVLGVYLLRRQNVDPSLERSRDVVALISLAAVVSPVVSATVGVLSLEIGGVVAAPLLRATWTAWWLGDVLGALVVAPMLLVWLGRPLRPGLDARRRIEGLVLFVSLVVVALTVFHDLVPADRLGLFQKAYLAFPFVIWAAIRFRQRGAVTAIFLVSAIAISGTVLGHGPFMEETLTESLLHLQLFTGIIAITALVVAATVAERDNARVQNAQLFEQAQEAVQARDEFLSVASHELRTPLTTLELQVEILRRSLAGTDAAMAGEKVEARVVVIQRQLKRLSALVNDLLDVSRAVAGRFALELEPVDLGAVVAEATERLQEQARRSGCELVVTTRECLGHWDRLRIDQIVTNLVSNAIKFGPGMPLEVTVLCEEERAILRVRDRGIGIRMEDQQRVFERFERAVSKRHFGGLGLGLWIVRQIVIALGGTIAVKSEPGHGSEFTVTLPRRLATASGDPPAGYTSHQ